MDELNSVITYYAFNYWIYYKLSSYYKLLKYIWLTNEITEIPPQNHLVAGEGDKQRPIPPPAGHLD